MASNEQQFTFGERLGLFFTVEGACLSLVSVAFILCFAGYRWMKANLLDMRGRSELSRPSDASDSSLFINLMLADFIQALGILPNTKWMSNASIIEGQLCTAQAAVKQVGIVGVSLTSLAIAIHTFCILVLRWKPSPHSSKFVVLGVWVATGLIIGSGNAVNRHKTYYGPSGYWCWILDEFKVEQIVTEYLWVWLAGASMIILYGIMFIVIREWFIIDHGIHWYKSYERDSVELDLSETEDDRQTKAIANSMLYYPAVYVFCVFPNSLSRWLYFDGHDTPYQFTLFANSLYALSGMLNVILFFVTRPEIVVGSQNAIPDPEIPLASLRRDHVKPPADRKHGYLPERRLADPSEDMEKRSHSEFSPVELYHSAPALAKQTSTAGMSLRPERDERRYSKLSSSGTEYQEEDMGRLPG